MFINLHRYYSKFVNLNNYTQTKSTLKKKKKKKSIFYTLFYTYEYSC